MFAQCSRVRETHVMLRVLVKYGLKDPMGDLLFAHLLCTSVVPTWEWWWVLNTSFNVSEKLRSGRRTQIQH